MYRKRIQNKTLSKTQKGNSWPEALSIFNLFSENTLKKLHFFHKNLFKNVLKEKNPPKKM